MFTGIVEETGTVQNIASKKNLSVLNVRAGRTLKGLRPGASVAVNGVCLTVTEIKRNVIAFDLMRETLLKTNLGTLRPNDRVNLERSLKANGRIDGHFVFGHVDDMGRITSKITKENYTELRISLKKPLMKYIVPKGAVCLDGVSLTVGEVKTNDFSVYLIPFTMRVTTLGRLKKGDKVNVETDILAKYVIERGRN